MSLSAFSSFGIFLLVLSGLVFVHELGHFLAARYFGIHIEEFGIGFPPRLVGAVRDAQGRLRFFAGQSVPKDAAAASTIYSLNMIPLGGFVRPRGEDDPTAPGGLASASKRARITVLAAGAAFNLLFAFLIFVFGFRLGWPDGGVYVASVVPDSPAARAGLRVGDLVLEAGGREVRASQDLSQVTYGNLGQPIQLVIQRDGQNLTVSVTPRRLADVPSGQGPMGISMGREVVQYSWLQSIGRAVTEMRYQFEALIHLPALLIQQQLPLEAARPCGPVCLNDLTREAVNISQEVNALYPILQLISLVSVALAITNLLPLPALDGGRILFVLIEAVRGRRLDPAREGLVHLVGLVMLLALMIVITYQDIVNPIIPR